MKARKIGLFYFFLRINKDNFENLLGRIWRMKNSDKNHCFTRFLLQVLVL